MPSCLRGRAILHLLLEAAAEGLEIRFQKPDVAAHHAEMRDLLSLDPKIHGLRADTKEARRLANGQRAVRVARTTALEDPGEGWLFVHTGKNVRSIGVAYGRLRGFGRSHELSTH